MYVPEYFKGFPLASFPSSHYMTKVRLLFIVNNILWAQITSCAWYQHKVSISHDCALITFSWLVLHDSGHTQCRDVCILWEPHFKACKSSGFISQNHRSCVHKSLNYPLEQVFLIPES